MLPANVERNNDIQRSQTSVFYSHTKSQRLLVKRHRLSREKVNLHNTPVTSAWDACSVSRHVGSKLLFWVHDFCPLNFLYAAVIQNVHTSRREMP